MAFEDPDLTNYEKQVVLLSNLFLEVPEDVKGALEVAAVFMNGGDIVQDPGENPRVYSFEKDAKYIYSAFMQTHRIDMQKVDLHWYEFLALFMDLGEDTAFSQIRSLRYRVKTGKATKKELSAYREAGDVMVIEEDAETMEEREANERFLKLIGAKE
jgi:hypothetical protein